MTKLERQCMDYVMCRQAGQDPSPELRAALRREWVILALSALRFDW